VRWQRYRCWLSFNEKTPPCKLFCYFYIAFLFFSFVNFNTNSNGMGVAGIQYRVRNKEEKKYWVGSLVASLSEQYLDGSRKCLSNLFFSILGGFYDFQMASGLFLNDRVVRVYCTLKYLLFCNCTYKITIFRVTNSTYHKPTLVLRV
jgi:hypothetical protein